MRIVVTGGTGLIGARVIAALSVEHDIWSITRQPVTATGRVTGVVGDLAQPALPAGLPERADVVIHLAQSLRYAELPQQAADVFAVNVASTARLLDWARQAGVRHFVLASTGAVDHRRAPRDFYVASRQSAELMAQTYSSIFTVLIARVFFAYGPGQRPSMLIPRLISSVRDGRAIMLSGDDGLRLNPVHAEDAARAIAIGATTGAAGEFDCAGPDVVSLRALAGYIGEAVGRPVIFESGGNESKSLIGDSRRMCEFAGPHRWSIREGVRDVVRASMVARS